LSHSAIFEGLIIFKFMTSLRTSEMKEKYQEYKRKNLPNDICPLCEKTALKKFKYWKITNNDFPYDLVASTHHMVISIRHVSETGLNKKELIDTQIFMKKNIYLFLHNIRSVYNIGAIFRTADAVGVSKIILSGYTPTPVDRFGNPRADFAKCSLGAEGSVAWEYVKSPSKLLGNLKKQGFEIISVEQSKNSVDYKKIKPKNKSLIIFGTEVSGISPAVLKKSDIIAEISMKGKKESLNVSVSAGIILYRWFDKWCSGSIEYD